MQIFSLFEAAMHAAVPAQKLSSDLLIGFHARVIPWAAGLGSVCDYVFLRGGEVQSRFCAGRSEHWACLRGGIRVSAPGRDAVLLGGGDVFTPWPRQSAMVQALLDSVLIRMVPDRAAPLPDGELAGSGEDPGEAPYAAFAALHAGDAGWACRLGLEGLRWAACHGGTLRLQWWPAQRDGVVREAYLQPGAAYAPDPDEDYCIDALSPSAGLFCCVQQSLVRGYGNAGGSGGYTWRCEEDRPAWDGASFFRAWEANPGSPRVLQTN